MQVLNFTNLPIYIASDTAEVPFGDPLSGVTVTLAAPGIVTVPGYNTPKLNDAVSFSFTTGGSTPAPFMPGVTYYVAAPIVNNTFALSLTRGGAAVTTTSTGSLLTAHLNNLQFYGTTTPFKPGASVVLMNLSGGSLILQGAPDVNSGYPGAIGSFGNPGGPGTYTTIATIAALSAGLGVLNYDWIRVSTAGTLVALQN